jgi:hypothetical protein
MINKLPSINHTILLARDIGSCNLAWIVPKTYNGWFELKGYEDQNIGWEPDIAQAACTGSGNAGTAPFKTNNHVAKCGFVNVFDWGQNSCTINNL